MIFIVDRFGMDAIDGWLNSVIDFVLCDLEKSAGVDVGIICDFDRKFGPTAHRDPCVGAVSGSVDRLDDSK